MVLDTLILLMEEDYEELLRPKEVAKIFNISVETLWEWQKKGIIRVVRLPTVSSAKERG
jgi:predicted DNA-binding transcriptional regulator AlpA